MRKFFDEWKSDLRARIQLRVWMILTVVVALAGPFGTYRSIDLPLRLAIAAILIAVAICVAAGIRVLVQCVRGGRRSFWACAVLNAVCLAILMPSLGLLVLDLPVYKANAQPPSWLELSLFTALCSLSVSAYRHGSYSRAQTRKVETVAGTATVMAPEADQERVLPRLLDRLPEELQGDLLSISVRDHYVDIRTCSGEASILLRLSDAIAETEGVDGAQIHRSHWVAWDAVEGAEKAATRLILRLRDGTQLPVSKTYRALVEEVLECRGIGIASTEAGRQARASAEAPIRLQSAG